jgi:hypothetical protein
MSDYETAIGRMFDWTADAAAIDRLIAGDAEETADAQRRDSDALTARRRDLELAIAQEVTDVAARRRHLGRPTTHDVALAMANVATRLGYGYDTGEVADTLSRDPELIGEDYRPLAG